jgi:hypothetical protein
VPTKQEDTVMSWLLEAAAPFGIWTMVALVAVPVIVVVVQGLIYVLCARVDRRTVTDTVRALSEGGGLMIRRRGEDMLIVARPDALRLPARAATPDIEIVPTPRSASTACLHAPQAAAMTTSTTVPPL